MKKRTLCRVVAMFCLISVLAACARESAATEDTPPAVTDSPSPEPTWMEAYKECERLIANCLEQNKSRLPLYEILGMDRGVFFDGYDGGVSQVIRYEPDQQRLDAPVGGICMTNDVCYWLDESGSAAPQRAAQELVTVMLEHLKSLPEDKRLFTITEYSVNEQTLYGWEDLPSLILGGTGFRYDMGYDESVSMTKDRLERLLVQDEPFGYTGVACALGEDMWAFVPRFTVSGGNIPDEEESKAGDFTCVLIRDGNIWRMQRAGAMSQMFEEAAFIGRMGGHTLGSLELGIIEGAYYRQAYINDAGKEYLRRIALDPEGMYAHMDELGFPRLAYLCSALSYDAVAEGFEPSGGRYSAELLGKYIAFHRRGEHALPPATGVICPPPLSRETRAMTARIQYADERILIFQAGQGLFAYDLEREEFVFSADVLTAMGWTSMESSWVTRALVDADGGRIRLAYSEEQWDHWQVRYEIDTGDWSWEFVDYELPNSEIGDVFEYDVNSAERGKLEWETSEGDGHTDLLKDLVYIRGAETLRLFDGVDFSAPQKKAPVPSKNLEQSIHNVIMALDSDYGDFECEAHETLGTETLPGGGVKCYLAVERGGYSRAGGTIVQSSGSLKYYAMSFMPDADGYYVFAEKDGVNGPWGEEIARIFPEELRDRIADGELEERLGQSCLAQALDYFGLPAGTLQYP